MNLPAVIDTHAHLTDQAFVDRLEQIVQAAKEAGLVRIGVIGFDATTSKRACELAAEYPEFLFASVGIQPNSVVDAKPDDWDCVVQLLGHPSVRALGETGLDLYWKDTPLAIQRDYFDRHIQLSLEHRLPLVIHLRDSGREIVEQLQPYSRQAELSGVMHSFTGDVETCRECLNMGLHISFAGMLTFKKTESLRDIAKWVPMDRVLVETDSPYLSPEPLRGKKPNEPARVVHTLKVLAEIRGVSYTALAAQTTANAMKLFRLTLPS